MELDRYNAPLIFGTADCQGFGVNNTFYVVELALKAGKKCEPNCFLFRPSVSYNELSKKDKTTVYWLTNYYHGLPYDLGFRGVSQDEVVDKVIQWYKLNMIVEKPYVGVMNQEMEKILLKAGIPYVICRGGEGSFLPTTKELMTFGSQALCKSPFRTCGFHVKKPETSLIRTCAVKKSMYLWHWLQTVGLPQVFGIKTDDQKLSNSFALYFCDDKNN